MRCMRPGGSISSWPQNERNHARGEYVEYFRQWVEDGYQVVHINLGSNLSSAYQNCCIAAEELGNALPG